MHIAFPHLPMRDFMLNGQVGVKRPQEVQAIEGESTANENRC